MPGKLSSQEIESIYRAAAARARSHRAQSWPDIRPARHRRRRGHFAILLWSGMIVVSVVGVGVFAATSDRFNFRNVGTTLLSFAAKTRAPGDTATPAPARPAEAPRENRLAQLPAETAAPAATAAPEGAAPAPSELRLDNALDTVFPISRDPDATAQPAAPEPPVAATPNGAGAPEPSPAQAATPAPAPAAAATTVATAPPPAPPVPAKPAASSPTETKLAALTGATAPAPPAFPRPPRRPRFAATATEPAPAPPAARAETSAPRHAALSSALARHMTPPPVSAAPRAAAGPGPGALPSAKPPVTAAVPGPTPPDYWVAPAAPVAPDGASSWLATTSEVTSRRTEPGQVAATADCTANPTAPGCATPPRHYSWYAGAQLSVAGNAVSKFTAPNVDLKAELEKAGAANLFAGYRASFGTRFEAELFHRRHGFDETTVNSDGGAGALLGVGSLSGVSGDGAGHLSMTGVMANVFQDFKLMNSVKPFIGGGIGVARINVDNGGLPQAALLDGDDDVLAYQLAGGIAFALRDNLDLFVEYRYFATDDYDIRYVTGATARGSLETHNFGVGIRYGF